MDKMKGDIWKYKTMWFVSTFGKISLSYETLLAVWLYSTQNIKKNTVFVQNETSN